MGLVSRTYEEICLDVNAAFAAAAGGEERCLNVERRGVQPAPLFTCGLLSRAWCSRARRRLWAVSKPSMSLGGRVNAALARAASVSRPLARTTPCPRVEGPFFTSSCKTLCFFDSLRVWRAGIPCLPKVVTPPSPASECCAGAEKAGCATATKSPPFFFQNFG